MGRPYGVVLPAEKFFHIHTWHYNFKNTYTQSRFKKWYVIRPHLTSPYTQAIFDSRYKNATTMQKERQSKFPNISVNTVVAVGVVRGKWVTLVQSMCMMLCSMSASTRWHRPLATLWIFEFVSTDWSTQSDTSSFTLSESLVHSLWSLRLISTPSHRQSTFELCVLPLSLSQTTPHQNSVGD